jgi:hypothetical protein
MVLTFAIPVSRDFVRVATEGSAPSKILASGIFQLQFGLGLFAFLMAVIVNEWPKVSHTLSRIFNYRLIMTIGIAILLACIILEAAPIAGWWWTWLTVGLHIATILLAVVLAHCKGLESIHGIILGMAVVAIAVGLWEIPYQILRLNFVDLNTTPEIIRRMVASETLIELPLIIGGALTLWFYQQQHKILNFKWPFWTLLLLTAGLYTAWWALGFDQEVIFDWQTNTYIQLPTDITTKTIYRASKATLALTLLSPLWDHHE